MVYDPPLMPGRLIRRYKRFLADVQLAGGERIVAHVANTGAMRGCSNPGADVWVSKSRGAQRKLRHTLEIVDAGGALVGVHTGRANDLVMEALFSGALAAIGEYEQVKREAPFDDSRIDFLLQGVGPRPFCFVEVKSVTLVENQIALFPDTVTLRGQKHLATLRRAVETGHRAAVLFVVQRGDGAGFRPADAIDPEYGRLLREAHERGVEIFAYRCWVSPEELRLADPIPWEL